ncbi:hypothetical protein [Nonomuraea sp. NPDC050405]
MSADTVVPRSSRPSCTVTTATPAASWAIASVNSKVPSDDG